MATAIEWTEETWNPVTGCDRVSEGCTRCYAMALAARLKRMGQPGYQNDGDPRTSGPGFALTLHPDRLDQPLRWRKPRRVFVNSMSDLFHPDVPADFIQAVFATMAFAHRHTFQVLTKRPQRMPDLVDSAVFQLGVRAAVARSVRDTADHLAPLFSWPAPNVWLGTSVESDRYTFRADHLRATPAAVRFLSLEPLIGPLPSLDLTGIDWVIVGGESGHGHRPIEADWVRDIRDRCLDSGAAFFFKQWGGHTPKAGGRELDGETWSQYPTPSRSHREVES